MEIPLHPEIERVARQMVEGGGYPSLEVLFEEALFLLVERDWSQSQADLNARMPAVFGPEAPPETEGERP